MAANTLVDTGAILAILDRDDEWHQVCVKVFQESRLPWLTSEAVLTELFHLAEARTVEVVSAWRFVRTGALTLGKITDTDLPAISELMLRYKDCPMDFADATLVYLAQRESLNTILTVDVTDFQIYRIDGKKRFRILPDPSLFR